MKASHLKNFTLIGGMPSSGSSLLSTMLDCHPEVYCGPETGIFSQPAMWNKSLSVKEVLLSKSMDIHQGITWVGPSKFGFVYNGHTQDQFVDYLNGDPSVESFVDWFFAPRLKKNKASVICEKTPSNAYGIASALRAFKEVKGIFMVRSLGGVIKSLGKRDYNVPYAMLRWLVAGNLAVNALEVYGAERVKIIRYEDLVNTPQETLRALCTFLGISEDSVQEMIALKSSDRFEDDPSITGSKGASAMWKNLPGQGISKTSLEVPELDDEALLYAKTLTLDPSLIAFYSHGVNAFTPSATSRLLGYPPLPTLVGDDLHLGQIRDVLMEGMSREIPNTPIPRFYWQFLTGKD